MRKRGGLLWLFTCLMVAMAAGQNLVWKDTAILMPLRNPCHPGIPMVQYRFTQELEYAFTFSDVMLVNWKQGNGVSQVSLLQQVRYRSQLHNARNLSISTLFIHSLGIQFFFDSISRFQPDENNLDTRIEINLRKNFTFTFHSNLSTRLFNAYDYSSDPTGALLKTLNSSFLTPLLCTFSAGFGLNLPRLGSISVGLSAAKLTLVSNRAIYSEQAIDAFYGVPKDRSHLFEYGLTMHLLVDKDFFKRIHWNCDLLIFKNYRKPVDLIIRNLVGVTINKFLKTSIQTRLYYEKEVSKSIQIENMVSVGFYFNL
ncbi:MAG: DUF3078 domain-containing protein [Bacteroidota bacterium]